MKTKIGRLIASRDSGDPSPADSSSSHAGGSMKIGTKIFGLV